MSRVATQLDELRDVVAEIDALAALALESFGRTDRGGADRHLAERVAYVLRMIARLAATAASKLDGFRAEVADTQPAPNGDQWSGGAGGPEQRERRSITISLASVEQLLRVGAAYRDEGRTRHPVDPVSTRSQPDAAVRVATDAKGPPQEVLWQLRRANHLHAHEMKVLWQLRQRCAEVFGQPPSYPFFRERYLPGEASSDALLRMFKRLQFCGSLTDEQTVSAMARRSHR